jgi:hypothetical protein
MENYLAAEPTFRQLSETIKYCSDICFKEHITGNTFAIFTKDFFFISYLESQCMLMSLHLTIGMCRNTNSVLAASLCTEPDTIRQD